MDRLSIDANAQHVLFAYRAGLPPKPKIFGRMVSAAADLVTGPIRIMVKYDTAKSSEYDLAFELIYRLFLRLKNGSLESWAVFRREREWHGPGDKDDPSCILSHMKWDSRADYVAQRWKDDGSPAVDITLRYVPSSVGERLGNPFERLDHIIMDGIPLRPRPLADEPSWREFSLERWLDWGMVELIWNNSLQHEGCEEAGMVVVREIEVVLRDDRLKHIEIPQFKLVSEWSPYLLTAPSPAVPIEPNS
jgi:hypothetical protein